MGSMTLDEQIEFYRNEYEAAKSPKMALVAFGAYMALVKSKNEDGMKQDEGYRRSAKAELIHRASAHLDAAFHIEKLARELPVSKAVRETVDRLGGSLRDKAVALKNQADAIGHTPQTNLAAAPVRHHDIKVELSD